MTIVKSVYISGIWVLMFSINIALLVGLKNQDMTSKALGRHVPSTGNFRRKSIYLMVNVTFFFIVYVSHYLLDLHIFQSRKERLDITRDNFSSPCFSYASVTIDFIELLYTCLNVVFIHGTEASFRNQASVNIRIMFMKKSIVL